MTGDQANWFPRPRKSSAAFALSSDLCAPKGNETRRYALSASGFAGGSLASTTASTSMARGERSAAVMAGRRSSGVRARKPSAPQACA
jgi:hypothetical protein